jgi:hypothetical protein
MTVTEKKPYNRIEQLARAREIKAKKKAKRDKALQKVENKVYSTVPELVKDFSVLDGLAFNALEEALLEGTTALKLQALKEWLYIRFELPSKLQVEHSIADSLKGLSIAELERLHGLRSKEDLMIEITALEVEDTEQPSSQEPKNQGGGGSLLPGNEKQGGTCSTVPGEENTYTTGGSDEK